RRPSSSGLRRRAPSPRPRPAPPPERPRRRPRRAGQRPRLSGPPARSGGRRAAPAKSARAAEPRTQLLISSATDLSVPSPFAPAAVPAPLGRRRRRYGWTSPGRQAEPATGAAAAHQPALDGREAFPPSRGAG